MWTYKVCFRIALYPRGVDNYHYEDRIVNGKIFVELVHDDIFDDYLCSELEAPYVIKHLISIYKGYSNSEDIYNIMYIGNGNFICNIIHEPYSDELDMQRILCPDDPEEYYLFIDGKYRSIDLKIYDLEVVSKYVIQATECEKDVNSNLDTILELQEVEDAIVYEKSLKYIQMKQNEDDIKKVVDQRVKEISKQDVWKIPPPFVKPKTISFI
jgi:hypothetical protein